MSDKVVITTKNSIITVPLNKRQLVLPYKGGVSKLPTNIGNLTELTQLHISHNELTNLPESIGNLRNLFEIIARDNNLQSIPESIGNLSNLETLDLFENKMITLPESIGRLTKLSTFYLGDNPTFTHLPESIGNLKNLKVLDLRDNPKLTALPESIGNLENLSTLELTNTNITSLPESFGNLKNLHILVLRGVSLRSLPNSFKNLDPNLKIVISAEGVYSKDEFLRKFKPYKPKRVTKNTQFFNKKISNTNKISNIPKNKRAYINTNSNVKNNGTLRRVYHKNGINAYMRGKNRGRLHSGNFTKNNVKTLRPTNSVNKNVYLSNIKARLQNSTLNNLRNNVNKIKTNLPSNVSKNDVNNVVRNMKPFIINKIFNKLKNSPSNNRVRIMNAMKNKGLMNNSDINTMKKKLS